MSKVSGHTYRITIRLKSSGGTGKVSFRVKGLDTKGGAQSTLVAYPLH